MNWLPSAKAYAALVERGMTEVEAAEELTAKISTFALLIKPHRLPDRQYGPSWITNPIVDFRAGTIAMPLQPAPSGLPSWDDLHPRLTPVLFDVRQDQFESLWPAAENPMKPLKPKRGRPFEYDWIEGEAFAHHVMDRRGDPTNPNDQADEWKTESDLARLIAKHLSKDGADNEPDFGLTRKKAKEFIESWRARQRELIGKD
jgi:hypothetical protein